MSKSKTCPACGLNRSIPIYANGPCPRCGGQGLMKWEHKPGYDSYMKWPGGITAHWVTTEFGDSLAINYTLPEGGFLSVMLPFRTEEELKTFMASFPAGSAIPFGQPKEDEA